MLRGGTVRWVVWMAMILALAGLPRMRMTAAADARIGVKHRVQPVGDTHDRPGTGEPSERLQPAPKVQPHPTRDPHVQPKVVSWVNRIVERPPYFSHNNHVHYLRLSDLYGTTSVWDVIRGQTPGEIDATFIGGIVAQEGTYGAQVIGSVFKSFQADFCAQTWPVEYVQFGTGGRRLFYHDTDQTFLFFVQGGRIRAAVDVFCNARFADHNIGYWTLNDGGVEYRSSSINNGYADTLYRFDLLGNLLQARVLDGDLGQGRFSRDYIARFGNTIALVTSAKEFIDLYPNGGTLPSRFMSRLTGEVRTTPPPPNTQSLIAVLWKISTSDLSLVSPPYYVRHPEVLYPGGYSGPKVIGIPTHDGGFVVAMQTAWQSTVPHNALVVVRIDANMQKVWEKRFTPPYAVALAVGRIVEIQDTQGNTTGYMLTVPYYVDSNLTSRIAYFYLDASTGDVRFVRDTAAGLLTATPLIANAGGKIILSGDPGPGNNMPPSVSLWEGVYDAVTGAYEGAYVRAGPYDPHGRIIPRPFWGWYAIDTIGITDTISVTEAISTKPTLMDSVLPPLQFFGQYLPALVPATFDPNAPEPMQSTTSVTVTDTNDVVIAPLPLYGYTAPGTSRSWTLPGGQTATFVAMAISAQDVPGTLVPHRTIAPAFITTNDFIEFGTVPVGRQVSQTVTVTRVLDDAYIWTIGWRGGASGDFTQFQFTHNCDTTQQGQTCDITVTYTPTAAGTHFARLFVYRDPGGPFQYIGLSGTAVPGHTLTVSKDGTGTGRVTSDPAGIDCGPTCTNVFAAGDTVILTANPDPDSVLTQWGGDCAVCGNSVTCTVTMDTDHTCSVTFDLFDRSRADERHGQTDALVADLVEQTLTMTDGTVTGALSGTFTWTTLRVVTIGGSGEFAGQGFASGTWTATLDTVTYTGTWTGVVHPEGANLRIRGVTEGDIVGVLQGTVADINGTLTFTGDWELKKLGAQFRTAELEVAGTLNAAGSGTYPGVTLYVLQSNMVGSVTGDYQTDIDLTLTHVRVQDPGNPHDGQGFLTASYAAPEGSGMLWCYALSQGGGLTDLTGFATRPLRGFVFGTLDERGAQRSLTLILRRFETDLPPLADLETFVGGPTRVSPGATVTYVVTYRNEGERTAENTVVVLELPPGTRYAGSDRPGIYGIDPKYPNGVGWVIGDVAPGTQGSIRVRVQYDFGLPGGQRFTLFALYGTTTPERDYYLHPDRQPLVDVSRYIGYVPVYTVGSVSVDETYIRREMGRDPQFARLYRYALNQGYAFVAGSRMFISNGDEILVLMFKKRLTPDIIDTIYLERHGGISMLYRYDTDSGRITVFDDVSGFVFDADTLALRDIWEPPPLNPNRSLFFWNRQKVECYINGLVAKGVAWVVNGKFKLLGDVANIQACRSCYLTRNEFDCGTCAAAIAQKLGVDIMNVDKVIDVLSVIDDCNRNPGKYACSESDNRPFTIPGYPITLHGMPDTVGCGFFGLQIQYYRCECLIGCTPQKEGVFCGLGHYCNVVNNRVGCYTRREKCGTNSFCSASEGTTVVQARDPNAIRGPGLFVQPGEELAYRIDFENEGQGTAYGVYITTQLDTDLDDATLQISPVFDSDGNPIAGPGIYDPISRTITWFVGRLDPQGGPVSKGYTEFRVRLRDDAPQGTKVEARAVVYFPSVPETTPTNVVVSYVPFTVTAVATPGGTIEPGGRVPVVPGSDVTFTIVPDKYHRIADVLVDGKSVGPVSVYTIRNVLHSRHQITAIFVPARTGPGLPELSSGRRRSVADKRR